MSQEKKLSNLIGVQGFAHVQQFLEDLPKIGREQAIGKGLKAGGKYLRDGGKKRLRSAMKHSRGVSGNFLKAFSVKIKNGYKQYSHIRIVTFYRKRNETGEEYDNERTYP